MILESIYILSIRKKNTMFGYGGDLDHIKGRPGSTQGYTYYFGGVLKGLHVTLKAIKQALEFGLNMVALLSHTSHAPSTLICFLL